MWAQVFGEVSECWDGEMREELRRLFEESLDGVIEAAEVGVGRAGHCEVVDLVL